MRNPANPFPSALPDGAIVTDERCRCGHLRSEHHDSIGGAALGHGRCRRCRCQKFSWAAHVFSNQRTRTK